MKILYFSYIETNTGWGAECFVDDALRKLGHDVIAVDFKKHDRDLADKVLELNDFDVVFLQRGDWFPKEVLKSLKRPIVFWASELVLRCRDQDRLLYSGLFRYIFVHSKTCERIVSRINRLFRKDVIVKCLLNGYDSNLHRKLDNVQKTIDVLFIGSITKRRRKILDSLNRNITICEGVFGDEFVKMINSAKIVINIHSSSRPDTETRVFEVLGCGTFLLSEPLSEENPFKNGEHYVECRIERFPQMIDHYLANDTEREEIAEKGHSEALRKHSYYERTKNDIIPVLEKVCIHAPVKCPAIDRKRLFRYKKVRNSNMYGIFRRIHSKVFRKYQYIWDRIIDLYQREGTVKGS